MFINGEPISKYGAVMLGSPRISAADYKAEYKYQRTRTTLRHLTHDIGLKAIECNIGFLGGSAYEIQLKRSAFRAALIGALDLSFSNDRFSYFAEYTGGTTLESEYDSAAVSKLKFQGIQHLPLEIVSGASIYCQSTIPETDCRITYKSPAEPLASNNTTIGTVTFNSIQANKTYVVDGIDGEITINGTPATAQFIRLPYLAPGSNTITWPGEGELTIEYYPTFL